MKLLDIIMIKKICKIFKTNWSTENQILFFLSCIALLVIFGLQHLFNIESKELILNIIALIFSFVIYAACLNFYYKFKENSKLENIYRNEIDDLRYWASEEAMHKNVGNIKRLLSLQAENLDLHNCNLENAYFENLTFENSDISFANLKCSNLRNCQFLNCNFKGTSLCSANIFNCRFINCRIDDANFYGVILYEIDFQYSDLKTFSPQNNLHRARLLFAPQNISNELLTKIQLEKPDLLEKSIEKLNRSTDQNRT